MLGLSDYPWGRMHKKGNEYHKKQKTENVEKLKKILGGVTKEATKMLWPENGRKVQYGSKKLINIFRVCFFDFFSLHPWPFATKFWPYGQMAKIKSSLIFYPTAAAATAAIYVTPCHFNSIPHQQNPVFISIGSILNIK